MTDAPGTQHTLDGRRVFTDATAYLCTSCHQLFLSLDDWMDHANGPYPDVASAEEDLREIHGGEEIPDHAVVGNTMCYNP